MTKKKAFFGIICILITVYDRRAAEISDMRAVCSVHTINIMIAGTGATGCSGILLLLLLCYRHRCARERPRRWRGGGRRRDVTRSSKFVYSVDRCATAAAES